MRTINIYLEGTNKPDPDICYGPIRQEKDATVVIFDISDYIAQYGEGTPELYVIRPGETECYIAESVARDGTRFIWTLSDYDTQNAGVIQFEVYWHFGERRLKKSEIFQMTIARDING